MGLLAPVLVSRVAGVEKEPKGESLLVPDRDPRKFLPSEQQAMALLSMPVTPEDWPVNRQNKFA